MDDWMDDWDWPEEWEMIRGHITKIVKDNPQMATITCKFCGRVFKTSGSKTTHEMASKGKNNICSWSKGMADKQKRMVKFVPPKEQADKQKIANWYFNTNNYEDLNTYALGQYNKLLTTKENVDDAEEDDAEEDAKLPPTTPSDWSNLPKATLKRVKITPGIFGKQKAAASSHDVLTGDEFSMDEDLEWMGGVLSNHVLGKRSRSSSFEPLDVVGGRRKTRKKRRSRKKKRKTRKKRRKKRRKTRKKRRKKRRRRRKSTKKKRRRKSTKKKRRRRRR